MNKPVIYWDSTIFISLLKNEIDRPDGEFNGVLDCVRRIGKKEIVLKTYKPVTNSEVLEASMTPEAKHLFESLFRCSNVSWLYYNPRIDEIGKEIREYYQAQPGKNVGFADASHLAAAIHYQVDAFYTFDGGQRKKDRGLLELDGNVAGYQLLICKPPFTEQRLFFT